jgi:hypothetical protein
MVRVAAVTRLLIIMGIVSVEDVKGPGSQLREVLMSSNFDEGQAALQGEHVEQTKRPSALYRWPCRVVALLRPFRERSFLWIRMNVRSSLTTTR